MKRFAACLLLFLGVLLAAPAQAQRGYYRGRYVRPAPRRYYRAPVYGPRYYHAAPYRGYRGRYYYRPRPVYRRPGPAIIIRP